MSSKPEARSLVHHVYWYQMLYWYLMFLLEENFWCSNKNSRVENRERFAITENQILLTKIEFLFILETHDDY